MKTIIEANRP